MKVVTVIRTISVIALLYLVSSCKKNQDAVPINTEQLPTVGNLAVVQVASGSALVKAEILSDGSSAITEAGICWREGSAMPTLLSNAVAVDEKKGFFKATATPLQPNTKYTLRAYAKNKVGVAYSDTVSFLTKNMTYLPTLKTISAVESTPGNVLVTGEIVFNGGAEITEAGVCWSEFNPPYVTNSHLKADTTNGNYSCTVNDLKKGTKFYFSAYAKNVNGTAYGQVLSVTTTIPKQTVIVIRPAINIGLTTATLRADIIPNQDNTSVTFEYWTDTIASPKSITLDDVYSGKDTVKLSLNINGLNKQTTYFYKVITSNLLGMVVSANESFRTFALADIDGNLYHTIQIGDQTWLQENLKTTHYRNGDRIANVTNLTDWWNLNTGAYGWYNNDAKIGEVYGALYNWYTVNDPRGLAIPGWHVPTEQEWSKLNNYLGGYNNSGPKLMEAGTSHWQNSGNAQTNSTGFTALPNGGNVNDPQLGYMFDMLGKKATWWSADSFSLGSDRISISGNDAFLHVGTIFDQRIGAGIRLIKD